MPYSESKRFGGDSRDRRSEQLVDAHDLLRHSILETPPSFENLPSSVLIDRPLDFMDEAYDDIAEYGPTSDFSRIADELRYLHDSYDTEFSCSVVADHEGNLKLGPLIQGEKYSAPISAPLKRTEITTPSGLIVYRDEVISAVLHSHNAEYSFSLADIYNHFSNGRNSIKQIYVVRGNGNIDMAQISSDAHLIDVNTFRRLADLWSTYLDPQGMPRFDRNADEYNEFVQRIFNETLKIGFYTNQGNDRWEVLRKVT